MSPQNGKGRDRKGGDNRRDSQPGRGRISVGQGGRLPRWVRDEVVRSTPKDRRDPALRQLEQGVAAFGEEKHQKAFNALRKAKALAPRAATIRELLGLSAYYLGKWEEGLRELRTYRRLTGETTHMPVEMDCLRALRRDADVDKTWQTFQELGGHPATEDEARVVYASHLLDRGEVAESWRVIKPGRLIADPPEGTLRRWAVAAKVAAQAGDDASVAKLMDAIRDRAPDAPWLEDLEQSLR